jgi:hypothetical protein
MPDDRLRDAVLLLVGQRPPHATQRLQALPQPELDREVQVVGCRPRGRRLEQNENWSQGRRTAIRRFCRCGSMRNSSTALAIAASASGASTMPSNGRAIAGRRIARSSNQRQNDNSAVDSHILALLRRAH